MAQELLCRQTEKNSRKLALLKTTRLATLSLHTWYISQYHPCTDGVARG